MSLVLTLVVLQLLIGSGKAIYVCVSRDGSLCCLDSGPQFCQCCEHDNDEAEANPVAELVESNDCHADCCCQHEPDPQEQDSERSTPGFVAEECDCTHHLVTSGQAASLGRNTLGDQMTLVLQQFDTCVASYHLKLVVLSTPQIDWQGPPPLPDVAIAVLSTVSMRC